MSIISEDRKKNVCNVEVRCSSIIYKGGPAAELSKETPKKSWKEFSECPYERLEDSERAHFDRCGFVHACQGLCIGSTFPTPLFRIIEGYDYEYHPIIGPFVEGGSLALCRTFHLPLKGEYADACHLCY